MAWWMLIKYNLIDCDFHTSTAMSKILNSHQVWLDITLVQSLYTIKYATILMEGVFDRLGWKGKKVWKMKMNEKRKKDKV